MPDIRGLLFDKDGTLFDFQGTWGGWAADLVYEFAEGDSGRADTLAARIRLDRARRRFFPDSPMIAGTVDDAVALLLPGAPHLDRSTIQRRIEESSQNLMAVEAVPLTGLTARLRSSGQVLGVATNDMESVAVAQLATIGVLEAFDFVVGADSGHGAKPAPGQCLAFAAHVDLPVETVAMIGDSTHDLHAGRAAGMSTVAVLTGVADEHELAPYADVVLPDIGHLPRWLGLE
ncbi:HAD family hydrolase [Tropicimonas marinistellae]|uniref:HAD family hydrolase n=1 Tax=Tropicimonas marinistellae TaxID=1739787 RepID=UPI00082B1EAE|nr:HAD family hydrolase [Tropicimonas marinistellae]